MKTKPYALRKYEQEGVKKIEAAWAEGSRRVLYVLPGAGGKTSVGAAIAKTELSKRRRVLVIVGDIQSVRQWRKTLMRMGVPEAKIGIIQGGDPNTDLTRPIQIASELTIHYRNLTPNADVVIVDEAHHVLAPTWWKRVCAYPASRILGLTATPERNDRQPMSKGGRWRFTRPETKRSRCAELVLPCFARARNSSCGSMRRHEHRPLTSVDSIQR